MPADKLTALENELEALRKAFEQSFAGIERKLPLQQRDNLLRRIRQYNPGRDAVQRFRHQNILQRVLSYEQYWNRILLAMENGTYVRDIQRADRKLAESKKKKKLTEEEFALSEMQRRAIDEEAERFLEGLGLDFDDDLDFLSSSGGSLSLGNESLNSDPNEIDWGNATQNSEAKLPDPPTAAPFAKLNLQRRAQVFTDVTEIPAPAASLEDAPRRHPVSQRNLSTQGPGESVESTRPLWNATLQNPSENPRSNLFSLPATQQTGSIPPLASFSRTDSLDVSSKTPNPQSSNASAEFRQTEMPSGTLDFRMRGTSQNQREKRETGSFSAIQLSQLPRRYSQPLPQSSQAFAPRPTSPLAPKPAPALAPKPAPALAPKPAPALAPKPAPALAPKPAPALAPKPAPALAPKSTLQPTSSATIPTPMPRNPLDLTMRGTSKNLSRNQQSASDKPDPDHR